MSKMTSIKSIFAGFEKFSDPDPEKDLKVNINKSNENYYESENFNCPHCQESSLTIDEGRYVCTSSGCGKESGIVISEKQEWRSFADDNKDNSRCGMATNPLLPQASLGTVAQGNVRSGFTRLQIQNAMPSHERSRLDAIKLIKSSAEKLSIPGVLADMACYLYVKLTENVKVKRGPGRKALMANCQYVICKKKGEGSSCYVCSENLSEAYEITVKKFNEGSKLFAELSFYKTNCNNSDKTWNPKLTDSRTSFVKPTEPENIIRNVCKKLSFNDVEIASIIYITRHVKKLGIISSKMPQSIAAGCILLYVKEKNMRHIRLNKLSNFCTVSDATAKNTYNDLKKYKSFILPEKIEDLMSSEVGDCMPEKQLSKIYTAPRRAIPASIILEDNSNITNIIRGRPRKDITT